MEDTELSEREQLFETHKEGLGLINFALEQYASENKLFDKTNRDLLQRLLKFNDKLEEAIRENDPEYNKTIVHWRHHREVARGTDLRLHYKYALEQHIEFTNNLLNNISWLIGALALNEMQETMSGRKAS